MIRGGADDEVRPSVIILLPINVVHFLIAPERATECACGEEAMLPVVAIISPYPNIAISLYPIPFVLP
jgi:hypothetical protein